MFFPQKSQQTPKFTIFQLHNVLIYLIESEFYVGLNEIFGEKSGVCNVVIVAKFRLTEVNIHFNCKEICFNQLCLQLEPSFSKGEWNFSKINLIEGGCKSIFENRGHEFIEGIIFKRGNGYEVCNTFVSQVPYIKHDLNNKQHLESKSSDRFEYDWTVH